MVNNMIKHNLKNYYQNLLNDNLSIYKNTDEISINCTSNDFKLNTYILNNDIDKFQADESLLTIVFECGYKISEILNENLNNHDVDIKTFWENMMQEYFSIIDSGINFDCYQKMVQIILIIVCKYCPNILSLILNVVSIIDNNILIENTRENICLLDIILKNNLVSDFENNITIDILNEKNNNISYFEKCIYNENSFKKLLHYNKNIIYNWEHDIPMFIFASIHNPKSGHVLLDFGYDPIDETFNDHNVMVYAAFDKNLFERLIQNKSYHKLLNVNNIVNPINIILFFGKFKFNINLFNKESFKNECTLFCLNNAAIKYLVNHNILDDELLKIRNNFNGKSLLFSKHIINDVDLLIDILSKCNNINEIMNIKSGKHMRNLFLYFCKNNGSNIDKFAKLYLNYDDVDINGNNFLMILLTYHFSNNIEKYLNDDVLFFVNDYNECLLKYLWDYAPNIAKNTRINNYKINDNMTFVNLISSVHEDDVLNVINNVDKKLLNFETTVLFANIIPQKLKYLISCKNYDAKLLLNCENNNNIFDILINNNISDKIMNDLLKLDLNNINLTFSDDFMMKLFNKYNSTITFIDKYAKPEHIKIIINGKSVFHDWINNNTIVLKLLNTNYVDYNFLTTKINHKMILDIIMSNITLNILKKLITVPNLVIDQGKHMINMIIKLYDGNIEMIQLIHKNMQNYTISYDDIKYMINILSNKSFFEIFKMYHEKNIIQKNIISDVNKFINLIFPNKKTLLYYIESNLIDNSQLRGHNGIDILSNIGYEYGYDVLINIFRKRKLGKKSVACYPMSVLVSFKDYDKNIKNILKFIEFILKKNKLLKKDLMCHNFMKQTILHKLALHGKVCHNLIEHIINHESMSTELLLAKDMQNRTFLNINYNLIDIVLNSKFCNSDLINNVDNLQSSVLLDIISQHSDKINKLLKSKYVNIKLYNLYNDDGNDIFTYTYENTSENYRNNTIKALLNYMNNIDKYAKILAKIFININDLGILKILINKINDKSNIFNDPLMYSCIDKMLIEYNHYENILKYLIISFDDVMKYCLHSNKLNNIIDNHNLTSFLIDNTEIIKSKDNFGNIFAMKINTNNNTDMSDIIVKSIPYMNIQNKFGSTFLHTYIDNIKYLKIVLDNSNIISLKNNFGNTSLHECVNKLKLDSLELILSYCNDEHLIQNNKGYNFVMLLLKKYCTAYGLSKQKIQNICSKYIDDVKLLIQKNNKGKCTFEYFIKYSDIPVYNLKEYISNRNYKFETPIYSVCENPVIFEKILDLCDVDDLHKYDINLGSCMTLTSKKNHSCLKLILEKYFDDLKDIKYDNLDYYQIACKYNHNSLQIIINSNKHNLKYYQLDISHPYVLAMLFNSDGFNTLISNNLIDDKFLLSKIDGMHMIEFAYHNNPKSIYYLIKSNKYCDNLIKTEFQNGYNIYVELFHLHKYIKSISDICNIRGIKYERVISDTNQCSFCCNNKLNIVLPCGHMVCSACVIKMNKCGICRKYITHISHIVD